MPLKMIWIWSPKGDWRPKSLDCLSKFSRRLFCSDVVAGFTVGLVALPIAMALGIASGVTPQAGIYTAILGGFVASLIGGSNVQISGPSGAFVVLLGDIAATYGIPGLQTVTLMAGLILVFLGITRLGSAIKFLPRPIVVGFANGIAVLIIAKQIGDLLGLPMRNAPIEFLPLMSSLLRHLGSLDPLTSALAALSLTTILAAHRFVPKLSGVLVALVLGTCATGFLRLPIETIGTRFGGIPIGLPVPGVPDIRVGLIEPLIMPAFAIAILVTLESLLSAVVAESMDGSRHNSSVELIGQGFANILVPLVGGIPVAGAVVRTATNLRSGAKSSIAGAVHALTLMTFLFVGSPLTKFIPLASLAVVMLVVAYNMSLWREARAVVRLDMRQKLAWLVTFTSTVFLDLPVAAVLALAFAALLYVDRAPTSEIGNSPPRGVQEPASPLFSSILHFKGQRLGARLTELLPIVVLLVGDIGEMDQPNLLLLASSCRQIRNSGRCLILCGTTCHGNPAVDYDHVIDYVGRKNFLPHMTAALRRAEQIHNRFFGIGETMADHLKNAAI